MNARRAKPVASRLERDDGFQAAAHADQRGAREDVPTMQRSVPTVTILGIALAMACAAVGTAHAQKTDSKPMIYWCPDRPTDQQYVAKPGPGCIPIVEEKPARDEDDEAGAAPARPVNVVKLQREVRGFLDRYSEFLMCCATDPWYLDEVKQLEDEANRLFKAVRANIATEQIMMRGIAYTELLRAVGRAQESLRELTSRLEKMDEAVDMIPSLSYEAAGREQRRIRLEKEAIRKDYPPIHLPSSAPTGEEIGDTDLPTRIGVESERTSLPATTGTAITSQKEDTVSRTGDDIGVTPPTGREIGKTPPTGFAIGGDDASGSSLPARAGPSIGNSSLNK